MVVIQNEQLGPIELCKTHDKAIIRPVHYNDVIMGAIASQITSFTIVYSIVYSDSNQRKHQSTASLAFVCGEFTGDRWPVTRKMFPFDDVIMDKERCDNIT